MAELDFKAFNILEWTQLGLENIKPIYLDVVAIKGHVDLIFTK